MSGSSSLSLVDQWLHSFGSALAAGDAAAVAALFQSNGFWRDLLAFTWNIHTAEGREQIERTFSVTLPQVASSGWRVDTSVPISARGAIVGDEAGAGEVSKRAVVTEERPVAIAVSESAPTEPPPVDDPFPLPADLTEAWLRFETPVARCIAHVRLGPDGKAFTLFTAIDELIGFEESVGPRRPMGVRHGADRKRETWLEGREREARELGITRQPDVLVIGGGQGGLGLAARLKQLDVSTLVVDRWPRPGDSWRRRYKSLCLHDPVWYDHMPYLSFPPNWPVYAPKDKIADFLDMYARVMELAFWGNTEVRSARYDEAANRWTVQIERDGATLTLQPRHLVLATGVSGFPNRPDFPGAESFQGVQQHSSEHAGPEGFEGKRAVIIGSNNSAHDIAAALWEAGAAEVTMVQRSSTLVVKSESLATFGLRELYSERALERGIDAARADLMSATVPYRWMPSLQRPIYARIREHDADFYDALAARGFLLDFGEDDSGLWMKYVRRGSGYYIDVGASQLVANGEIRLEAGEVSHLTEDAVVLKNGATLPADLVVYATGYGTMTDFAVQLLGQDVADQLGPTWGIGSNTARDPGPWEGELRNMWKPTAQPGLWFHGGNLHQSRLYSKYLALQLKAQLEGLEPTPRV